MGADLLLSATTLPHRADGTLVDDDELVLRVIQARLDALSDETVDRVVDNWEPMLELSDDDLRTHCTGWAQDVLAALNRGYRTCTTMTLGGQTYLFSGGLSWGDDPSDEWTAVGIVGELGLFDEPIPEDV